MHKGHLLVAKYKPASPVSLEASDELREVISHLGFPILLKELEALVRLQEARVLKYDLDTQNEAGLVRLKCRAEGARKLLSDFAQHVSKLKAAE